MSKIINVSSLVSSYILPDGQKISTSTKSNTSSTENMTTSFTKIKTSEKSYVMPTEIVKQTLTLTNTSEFDIFNVKINEIISKNATFETGSLAIDGTIYESLNPIIGFDLPKNIPANSAVVVTYDLRVNSEIETDVINLLSQITYSVNEVVDLQENSNVVVLEIVEPSIIITKSAKPDVVIQGQIVTFTNSIENKSSTTKVTNIVFTDELPKDVKFVEGSIKIDGIERTDLNLENGIALNDLEPGKTTIVEFQAKVN